MLEPAHHANLLLRVECQTGAGHRDHDEQVGVFAYALAQLGHDLAGWVGERWRRIRPAPAVRACDQLPAK
jgi:hypothetical protein